MELKRQQEEALLQRRKELKSLSLEDLKKRAAKKGLEANGKKEDLVEAVKCIGIGARTQRNSLLADVQFFQGGCEIFVAVSCKSLGKMVNELCDVST